MRLTLVETHTIRAFGHTLADRKIATRLSLYICTVPESPARGKKPSRIYFLYSTGIRPSPEWEIAGLAMRSRSSATYSRSSATHSRSSATHSRSSAAHSRSSAAHSRSSAGLGADGYLKKENPNRRPFA
jgi:hypothetical protein